MLFLYFAFGYSLAALIWYLNHRFVFHGSLGHLPLFKQYRRLHTLHHQNAYNRRRNRFIFIPIWGHILLLLASIPAFVLSPWCWLGCTAFAVVYGYRHYNMHNGDENSWYARHHLIHHSIAPDYNFSGVHPIIDMIFGTSFDYAVPAKIKSSSNDHN